MGEEEGTNEMVSHKKCDINLGTNDLYKTESCMSNTE